MKQTPSNSTTTITEGIIWKQILLFFFPILFGTFFQQLYNTADAIIVGRFVGKEALSAVGGTTGTLINLLIGFFVGISSGATVIISQYYGAKNETYVQKAVHTAIALALTGGAILTVAGIWLAPVALVRMHTPEEILAPSLLYLRIYFAGTIANLLYNMGSGILRAVGDSKRPLYYLIAACVLNIGLDVLLVLVFRLGILGVALATVASQLLSAVLVCTELLRSTECYRLSLKKIRFHRDVLLRTIRIGLPAGFQSVMYNIANVIIQSNINTFGTDTVAAWTAYSKIDSMFWMIMSAFGVSVTTFVGQNYGAGKFDRVRRGVRVCLGMAMASAAALSLFLFFFGNHVYLLFADDPAVLEKGMEILRFLVPTYVTYVCIEIFSGSLRGMGKSFVPLLLTLVGVCVFRIAWITIMVPIFPEIRTIIVSYPLSWFTTSLLFLVYYRYSIKRMRL